MPLWDRLVRMKRSRPSAWTCGVHMQEGGAVGRQSHDGTATPGGMGHKVAYAQQSTHWEELTPDLPSTSCTPSALRCKSKYQSDDASQRIDKRAPWLTSYPGSDNCTDSKSPANEGAFVCISPCRGAAAGKAYLVCHLGCNEEAGEEHGAQGGCSCLGLLASHARGQLGRLQEDSTHTAQHSKGQHHQVGHRACRLRSSCWTG
jgi:hypothetical protein